VPADLSEFLSESDAKKKAHKLLVGKVSDMFARSGLEPDEAIVKSLKLYQGFSKDEDGTPQVTDLISVEVSPAFESGPEWPVVQPSKPVSIKLSHPGGKKTSDRLKGMKTAVVLPDMQIGYYQGHGGLVPTHDETAIDVALQIVGYLNPDLVICVGDNLDFPDLSTKYLRTPAFAFTTQAAVDRGGILAAQLRAAAPNAEIRWLEGNHELRLSTYITSNAEAAFGLKRSGAPESWPVLSVPFLCRFDEYDIEYIPGYPANKTWINDRVRVIHGHHVVSKGSTAHKYLDNERTSVVYGHIHRREWAERTREGATGPNTILAMSPGCLADIRGRVPSVKGGTDLDGIPVAVAEDWQQGVGVFTYEEGDGVFIPEQVPIHDGFTIFRGLVFNASDDSHDLMNRG
jgi:predicted phosphodiesterase